MKEQLLKQLLRWEEIRNRLSDVRDSYFDEDDALAILKFSPKQFSVLVSVCIIPYGKDSLGELVFEKRCLIEWTEAIIKDVRKRLIVHINHGDWPQ